MDNKQAFSDRLRRTLKKAGVSAASPTRLALEFSLRHEGSSVTAQSIRKWLTGQAIPAQDKILTLAQWLNVSSEWLRFGDNRGKETRQEKPAYQAMDLRLYGDLQRLNGEHKVVVQEIITTLLRIERGR
jgi:transcriptional regulator with XRE-family HTH domain